MTTQDQPTDPVTADHEGFADADDARQDRADAERDQGAAIRAAAVAGAMGGVAGVAAGVAAALDPAPGSDEATAKTDEPADGTSDQP